MNPKIIAASVATLLVAAGMFVYLGAGLTAAEPIQPASAEAGFAGQERRDVDPWMPAPGMGTLADASIDALHEISVGASPSEALQKASSSRALALHGNLDVWFSPEAVENCELKYWFMTNSFVNACDPWAAYQPMSGPAGSFLPVSGGWYASHPDVWGGWWAEFDHHPGLGAYYSFPWYAEGQLPGGSAYGFTGGIGYSFEDGTYELQLETDSGATFAQAGSMFVLAPSSSCDHCAAFLDAPAGNWIVHEDFDHLQTVSVGLLEVDGGYVAWAVEE